MSLSRLGRGEAIAALGAVLLFVSMFLDWFGAKVSSVAGFSGSVPGGGSAWQTLDVIPLFLMLAIVVALGVALIRVTDADLELPVSPNAVTAAAGALAVALIAFRIVFQPGGDQLPGVETDITLQLGIFLGLLAAGGIAYGGYSAMRDEGATFAEQAERLAERPRAGS